jgi:23S rRNA (cytosine1962-C5)-methyltransferase
MADSQSLLEAFGNRVGKRYRHLAKWARKIDTDCYRVYDRDIPEMPFALDVYGPRLLLQQYVRKGELVAPDWLGQVAEIAAIATGVEQDAVVARRREKVDRRNEQHQKAGRAAQWFPVREHGLRFLVDLETYLDTGLFLDHRPLRQHIRSVSNGLRFLNLFCYTGSFTVCAAAGGAASTTSVDLSNTYLDWARRNLATNGLEGARHSLIRADVLAWLGQARRMGQKYDTIFLDPPAYSSSKRMTGVFDVQRDHAELIGQTMELLSSGGELYFSCNLRGFKLAPETIGTFAVEDISDASIPEDFRNRSIHRCWRVRAPGG